MAQRSARRDRENQGFPPCLMSTLRVIWTRSANSHTGQHRPGGAQTGRTDGSIRLRDRHLSIHLALKGASTEGKRTFAPRLERQAANVR